MLVKDMRLVLLLLIPSTLRQGVMVLQEVARFACSLQATRSSLIWITWGSETPSKGLSWSTHRLGDRPGLPFFPQPSTFRWSRFAWRRGQRRLGRLYLLKEEAFLSPEAHPVQTGLCGVPSMTHEVSFGTPTSRSFRSSSYRPFSSSRFPRRMWQWGILGLLPIAAWWRC